MTINANFPAIRPSLNLDFANSRALDPRITFARASSAMYYDDMGKYRQAATNEARFDHDPVTGECKGLLIEESRTNLLTYSEQFDNAAWVNSNVSVVPDGTIAPDGLSGMDCLVENTATSPHHSNRNITISSDTTYTVSCYAKESGVGSKRYLTLLFTASGFGANYRATFDLAAGTFVTTNSTLDAGIQYVGNGIFRCWLTATATASGTSYYLQLRLSNATPDPLAAYTGDGVSGLYLWGAQLEAGAFPTSYIPSADSFTSRASAASFIGSNGLIQSAATDVARMQYNPLNLALAPKLLLEEARTNVELYSSQFDNAVWTKTRATVTPNAAIAPDGTMTAYRITEDATAANMHYTYQTTAIATQNVDFAVSCYVKAAGRTRAWVGIRTTDLQYPSTSFDLVAGTFVKNSALVKSAGMEDVGNGWWRIWSTINSQAGANVIAGYVGPATSAGRIYDGDGASGIYIWGHQLEQGSYPTSYIPTTSAQVTRAADVSTSAQATRAADYARMTGANFSSWYRQDEGTFVVSVIRGNLTNYGYLFSADAGSSAESIRVFFYSDGSARFSINDDTTTTVSISPGALPLGSHQVACAYQENSSAATWNGTNATVDSLCSIPTPNALRIGISGESSYYLNGHIARLTYYPKRLSNALLQELSR